METATAFLAVLCFFPHFSPHCPCRRHKKHPDLSGCDVSLSGFFFVFQAVDDELYAADDEVATHQDAQSEGQYHRMEYGVDPDDHIEDTDEDAPEPTFGLLLFPLNGGVDVDCPLKDEPYRHNVDEETVGNEHKAGNGQKQDAENGGEKSEGQIEIVFLFGDEINGADDTEDQKENGEEIAGLQKSGHGSADHCHTENRHNGAEDDEENFHFFVFLSVGFFVL